MAQHHEEYHITVKGMAVERFKAACDELRVKCLWIELNTFERQLMCAAKPFFNGPFDLARKFSDRGFEIDRVKQEIQPHKLDITCHGDHGTRWLEVPDPATVVYYECHAKFDGPFRPSWHMSSRDLLRPERWYATYRSEKPFDAKVWVEMVTQWAALPDGWRGPSTLAGWEYEAAVLDTNPTLDAHWSTFTR